MSRIGLQKRIMVYVAVGLVVMFGLFAYLGARAIQRSTDLVFQERLGVAQSVAAMIDQNFDHVAKDVLEDAKALTDGAEIEEAVSDVFQHLSETDDFTFFRITSVSLLDAKRGLLATAPGHLGDPSLFPDDLDLQEIVAAGRPTVLESLAPSSTPSQAGVPLASVVIPLASNGAPAGWAIIVETQSVNSAAPFNPHMPSTLASDAPSEGAEGQSKQNLYHLELMSSSGMAVLSISPDERAGRASAHFPLIRDLMDKGEPWAMRHNIVEDGPSKDHVMAVVPLRRGPFYLILEQDQDVALAVPDDLRRQLLILGSVGFVAALLAAWVTTRRVVKPTEMLNRAAQRIAAGHLAEPIRVKAQDEMGELAESLEAMRRNLKEAQEKIELTNKSLEARVKERTLRLEQVLAKVISAQEEERKRLARELHDDTAQALAALSVTLDAARDTPQTAEHIREAKAVATRLLEDTRRLIFDLRPSVLDDLGLVPAIRWYAEKHLEERGVQVKFNIQGLKSRLGSTVEVALFRIVQEAINNVAKHAGAGSVAINLDQRDSLIRVSVSDDGVGLDTGKDFAAGVGLAGMQERAALLGGKINLCSEVGRGATVIVEIPFPQEADIAVG